MDPSACAIEHDDAAAIVDYAMTIAALNASAAIRARYIGLLVPTGPVGAYWSAIAHARRSAVLAMTADITSAARKCVPQPERR